MHDKRLTLRVLSALLRYPDAAFRAAVPELARALDIERALPASRLAELAALLRQFQTMDPFETEARFVDTFDRGRATSLHLFEHVHGESRDRGQAMVDLAQTYATRGFAVADNELPDYLPAFLEFVSTLPAEEGKNLLKETTHIVRGLGDRLAERGSFYAAVFAELLRLAGEPGLTKEIRLSQPLKEDLAALDKSWMEKPVTFMDGPQPVKFYPKGATP
jgi:nitrate reductase delta subunit